MAFNGRVQTNYGAVYEGSIQEYQACPYVTVNLKNPINGKDKIDKLVPWSAIREIEVL